MESKQICKATLAVGLALSLAAALTWGLSAASTKALDWYPHRPKGQALPTVMPEAASFFGAYDGVFMGDPAKKQIFLTFDAGYENGCTEKILDVLRDKGVTAAFFLDGNYLRRNPALVQRMAAEGHLIGNHTLKHPDTTKLTEFRLYAMQLSELEAVAGEVGVTVSHYYRPPMGRFSEQTLAYDRQLGYRTVFWSVAYADWKTDAQPEPSAALATLTARAHPGAIYLLHSVSTTNAAILPQLIDALRAQGYVFASLDEL